MKSFLFFDNKVKKSEDVIIFVLLLLVFHGGVVHFHFILIFSCYILVVYHLPFLPHLHFLLWLFFLVPIDFFLLRFFLLSNLNFQLLLFKCQYIVLVCFFYVHVTEFQYFIMKLFRFGVFRFFLEVLDVGVCWFVHGKQLTDQLFDLIGFKSHGVSLLLFRLIILYFFFFLFFIFIFLIILILIFILIDLLNLTILILVIIIDTFPPNTFGFDSFFYFICNHHIILFLNAL